MRSLPNCSARISATLATKARLSPVKEKAIRKRFSPMPGMTRSSELLLSVQLIDAFLDDRPIARLGRGLEVELEVFDGLGGFSRLGAGAVRCGLGRGSAIPWCAVILGRCGCGRRRGRGVSPGRALLLARFDGLWSGSRLDWRRHDRGRLVLAVGALARDRVLGIEIGDQLIVAPGLVALARVPQGLGPPSELVGQSRRSEEHTSE